MIPCHYTVFYDSLEQHSTPIFNGWNVENEFFGKCLPNDAASCLWRTESCVTVLYPLCFKQLNVKVSTDTELTESNKLFSLVELLLWHTCITRRIEELHHAVAILTCTQEISCSDLSRDRNYADWGYSWFSSVPPDKILPATWLRLFPSTSIMPYIIPCRSSQLKPCNMSCSNCNPSSRDIIW